MSRSIALSWAVRISRAESLDALDRLMDDWYGLMQADRYLQAVVGFDFNMDRRDWNAAKGSIERTYGRSSREQQATLDTLAAAIQCRKMLAFPPIRR